MVKATAKLLSCAHESAPLMTLRTLFLDRLAMIYDAEIRLTEAMQQMATAATCDSLQEAIKAHLQEKKDHVASLQAVFESLGEKTWRKTSEATIALLYESHDVVTHFKGFPVINAALIAAVQKIEHYEIASYGCLRDWAAVLGCKEVAATLQKILDQDKATNRTLTELARTRSNQEALHEHANSAAEPLVARRAKAIAGRPTAPPLANAGYKSRPSSTVAVPPEKHVGQG
jgi:ferritin-like metal-binding protein YciE